MLVLAALLVAGQAVARPSDEGVEEAFPARDECSAVQVTSPQQQGLHAVFSASRVYDLHFRTILGGTPDGPHLLELRLYTPNGHLYQVLSVPFTGRHGARREPSASATLPVAGTAIMTSSLYGRWRVEPHLDGSPVPCGRSRGFVIEQ